MPSTMLKTDWEPGFFPFPYIEACMMTRYRVAVAEAEEYSEGISFMHIRRIIIDQGYGLKVSWSSMEQKIGRALRSCSHADLTPNLRNVQVDMFVTVHRQIDKQGVVFIKKNAVRTFWLKVPSNH